MVLYFGMQLIPIAFGVLYLVHSFKRKRRGQGIAALSLLLVLLASLSVLLWEYFAVP